MQAMSDRLGTIWHSTKLHICLYAYPAEPIGLHPQDLRLLQKICLYLTIVTHFRKHLSRFSLDIIVATLVGLFYW